jgi:hypothetical protein
MSTRLFGRAWNVQVLTPPDNAQQQTLLNVSSSDRETQSLRVTFDITQTASDHPDLWWGEVTIYNPNLATIGTLVSGCTVSVSAGYQQEGTPGEIFRGALFQPIIGKEDATTTFVKLRCFVGLPELTDRFVRVTIGPGATQRQIVLAIAQNCFTADNKPAPPIPVDYLAPDDHFKIGPLPRSTTIFGHPWDLFGQVARGNNMLHMYGPSGVSIGRTDGAGNAQPDLIYAPPISAGSAQKQEAGVRYCLIGNPQQTEFGVDFRVLLDSRLTAKLPPMQAQIKNAVIEQLALQVGTKQTTLTQDVVYFVAGVRHLGDTRGNLWESRVIGTSSLAGLSAIFG